MAARSAERFATAMHERTGCEFHAQTAVGATSGVPVVNPVQMAIRQPPALRQHRQFAAGPLRRPV